MVEVLDSPAPPVPAALFAPVVDQPGSSPAPSPRPQATARAGSVDQTSPRSPSRDLYQKHMQSNICFESVPTASALVQSTLRKQTRSPRRRTSAPSLSIKQESGVSGNVAPSEASLVAQMHCVGRIQVEMTSTGRRQHLPGAEALPRNAAGTTPCLASLRGLSRSRQPPGGIASLGGPHFHSPVFSDPSSPCRSSPRQPLGAPSANTAIARQGAVPPYATHDEPAHAPSPAQPTPPAPAAVAVVASAGGGGSTSAVADGDRSGAVAIAPAPETNHGLVRTVREPLMGSKQGTPGSRWIRVQEAEVRPDLLVAASAMAETRVPERRRDLLCAMRAGLGTDLATRIQEAKAGAGCHPITVRQPQTASRTSSCHPIMVRQPPEQRSSTSVTQRSLSGSRARFHQFEPLSRKSETPVPERRLRSPPRVVDSPSPICRTPRSNETCSTAATPQPKQKWRA